MAVVAMAVAQHRWHHSFHVSPERIQPKFYTAEKWANNNGGFVRNSFGNYVKSEMWNIFRLRLASSLHTVSVTCCFVVMENPLCPNTRALFSFIYLWEAQFRWKLLFSRKIKANIIYHREMWLFFLLLSLNKQNAARMRTGAFVWRRHTLGVSIIQSFLPIYQKCLLELSSCIFFESFNF